MDRAGLITLEQARAAGLSFDEPEPRACPHCGALDPLGAALAGRVAWVSAAPCPCEGAASERGVRGAKARGPRRQGGGRPPGEGALARGHPQALLGRRGRPPRVRRVHRLVRGQRGRRALHTRGRRRRQDARRLRHGQAVRRGRLRRRLHDGQGHARARRRPRSTRAAPRPPSRGTPSATSSCSTTSARRRDGIGPSAPCSRARRALRGHAPDHRHVELRAGRAGGQLARRGERVTAEAIASRSSQTCRTVYLGGRDRRRLG